MDINELAELNFTFRVGEFAGIQAWSNPRVFPKPFVPRRWTANPDPGYVSNCHIRRIEVQWFATYPTAPGVHVTDHVPKTISVGWCCSQHSRK
jgi:hypothetical protein